jgi:hypothetical protein
MNVKSKYHGGEVVSEKTVPVAEKRLHADPQLFFLSPDIRQKVGNGRLVKKSGVISR